MVKLLVIDDKDIKNNDIQKLAQSLKGYLNNEDELLLENEFYDNELDDDLLKQDFASDNFGIKSKFVIASLSFECTLDKSESLKIQIENELKKIVDLRANFEINWQDDFVGMIFFEQSIINYEKVLQKLKDVLKFNVFIVLTQKIINFEDLADEIMIHEKYMDYYFYENKKIKIVEKCENFKSINYKSLNYMEILKEAKLINIKKMIILICEVLRSFEKQVIKPSDVKNFMKFILTNIKLVNLDITNGQLGFLDMAMQEVDNINSLDTLIEYIKTLETPLKDIFTTKRYRREVEEVIEFIHINIEKKITLEMIAGHISMNESYISRIFKVETGESIMHYINKVKVDRASKLLKDKNIMIKEVGVKVGVDDQFYFNKLFKKYKGVSPSEYRKF